MEELAGSAGRQAVGRAAAVGEEQIADPRALLVQPVPAPKKKKR